MRMALLIGTAILLAGCPQKISTAQADGGDGSDGAGSSDAPMMAGGPDGAAGAQDGMSGGPFPDAAQGDAISSFDDATAPDAPFSPGDTGTIDAGPLDSGTGGLGPIQWARMTIPMNTDIVTCVFGRSPGEIYAGTGNGKVLKFDTTNGWVTQAWSEPSNFGIQSVWTTAAKVYVASSSALHVHDQTIGPSPTSYQILSNVNAMYGVSDTAVYLVGDTQGGDKTLYKYDGMSVMGVGSRNDLVTFDAVTAVAGGRVYVGGNGHIFRYEQFTLTEEPVDWPADLMPPTNNLYHYFKGIAGVGTLVFAVGTHQLIFARDSGGTWRQSYTPAMIGQDFNAVAGSDNGGDPEAYAVGGDGPRGPIARYYRGTWSGNQYSDNITLYGIWAAGPNEYFATGTESSTFNGVILHGTR